MKTGLLPLGRATFDVEFARSKLDAMNARLDATGGKFVGARDLLLDVDATRDAIAELRKSGIDRLLILQVTFTDAAMILEAAQVLDVPIGIWAVPEPRLGGRLRLNAFCGLNLASHALGLDGRDFSWAYSDPDDIGADVLDALLAGRRPAGRLAGRPPAASADRGSGILAAITGKRIGRIGAHPDGFPTCAYSAAEIRSLAGVDVEEFDLGELFELARNADAADVAKVRDGAERDLDGLGEVDQAELERSLRLKLALDRLTERKGLDAFAIRCWPETFTEYGGAVCGPVSMMTEAGIPCACEADVYGALTQLILQAAARAPVFLTDLVDIDTVDDSAVVWHCGQAPVSMCAPDDRAAATIHTNRKMPLLYQFALKPGRMTMMRISQALGETKMILAGGEMLDRPLAFTGTSGVLRFDGGASGALEDILAARMEHHMAIAYGEHRPLLRSVAAAMDLPVLELSR